MFKKLILKKINTILLYITVTMTHLEKKKKINVPKVIFKLFKFELFVIILHAFIFVEIMNWIEKLDRITIFILLFSYD